MIVRPNPLLIFLVVVIVCAIVATALTYVTGGFASGYLQGKVTIGPLCPVERVNESCVRAPDYSTVKITITSQSGFAQQIDVNSSGDYRTSLAPGTHTVNAIHPYIRANGVPIQIAVKAGETVTVDMDIDTGIR